MALSDAACRNSKAQDRPIKKSDGGGLYLLVNPNGSRLWRMKYRFGGKERLLSLGAYPTVSLADAREKRARARRHLANGVDPKRAEKEGDGRPSFETIAREWHASREHVWKGRHSERVINRLEKNVFPHIGETAIEDVEASDILNAIREIEERSALDVARRVRQDVGQIMRYAIATGRARRDPAADLRGALKAKPKVQHRASLKDSEIPKFLADLDQYEGDRRTQLAIRLALLTVVRTAEIRFVEKSEFFDLEGRNPLWRIPAHKMKKARDHIVPLSRQAVAVVQAIMDLPDQRGEHLFGAFTRSGVMSENTMLYALYRMGYHSRLTVHGFRGTFSTIANEKEWNRDWVERQLAHVDDDQVRSAYNAAEWLPQRREMLQWWADYLDSRAEIAALLG